MNITKMLLLILALLLAGAFANAECLPIPGEREFRNIQEQIMNEDPTANVNMVMQQRIQICRGRCPESDGSKICIYYPETKKKEK